MPFDYQIVRSARRKTLGIEIKQGQVTVRVPTGCNDQFIQSVLSKKSAWIVQKISEQKKSLEHSRATSQQLFRQGCVLLYLGQPHTLLIEMGAKKNVQIAQQSIVITVNAKRYVQQSPDQQTNTVKKILEHYFKAQADQFLPLRLQIISENTELFPKELMIRQYKARWGSCSAAGVIKLNYLLMMLPTWIIDYVIIHELCHLQQLNHSGKFWQLVSKHCPNYQQAKQWLKQNAALTRWHK